MSSPAGSRPERFDLAVVALSARALAASARRAGLSALAIDLFADQDTREHAARAARAPASRRGLGFDRRGLLSVLEAHAPEGLPVVLGAGLEHAPGLMRAIARRNPIVGASAETVALLKDPQRFAALLRDLAVSHPSVIEGETVAAPHLSPVGRGRRCAAAAGEGTSPSPENARPPHPLGFASRPLPTGERWAAAALPPYLSKRVGASGGGHIREADAGGPSSRRYLQAFVPGRAVSALFLADGRAARILGFSEQWTDPSPKASFRYGGAVGPIALPAPLSQDIAAALDRIVGATGLVGLASADMILPDRGGFVLLEINPRPGATLDVFDQGETPSLIALHLDACAGRLPAALPAATGARAAAIVYADRPTQVATLRRPVWTSDWPSCDEIVPAGAPICTIVASGPSPSAARARLEERRAALLSQLRALPAAALNDKNTEEAPA